MDTPPDPRYVPPTYNPADYDRPSVTVDVVLYAFREHDLKVLLVRRKKGPTRAIGPSPAASSRTTRRWRRPRSASSRGDRSQRRLPGAALHLRRSRPRSPHRVISVAYFALVGADQAHHVRGGDDAAEARWWSMYDLPELAFDHERIVHYALQRLRWKLEYTALGFLLLPETFTLSELQAVYETVLHEKLDKRNFRRKILAADVLEETGGYLEGGPHRPAKLYRFTAAAIELEQARRRFP